VHRAAAKAPAHRLGETSVVSGIRAWQRVANRVVLDSPWLRVTLNSFVLPEGRRIPEYYIVERSDAAICVCRVGAQVLLVRQYRPGIGKETLCHPGGRRMLPRWTARSGSC
jgi:hypothetical protein